MENHNLTRLDSGILIATEYLPHVQSFSIGFWFNVGSRDETRADNGIAHFIEHILFKGTNKRSSKQISEQIEGYGGYLNAYTSKENTCFYARGLTKNFKRTFDVMADLVSNPLMRLKDISLESGVILDELLDINDNPEELIFDVFEESLFKDSSLAMPIIGTSENISGFSRDDLIAFHQKHYGGKNGLIVCSGNVEHDKVVTFASEYFNSLKENSSIVRYDVDKVSFTDTTISKEIEQDYCIIGSSGAGYLSKNKIPLNILMNILGDGSSSRLYQQLREKRGITYQINSFVNSYADISSIGVFFSTNQKNTEKAIDGVYKELNKLKEKNIGEKELKKGKEYLKGSMIISLENTTNRMMRMANSLLYHNRIITLEEHCAKIDAVTSDELLAIAKVAFAEENLCKIFIKANSKAA